MGLIQPGVYGRHLLNLRQRDLRRGGDAVHLSGGLRHGFVRRRLAVELELASINLYLGPLPETERHAVMKQLADRLFGHVEAEKEAKANEDITKMSLLEVFKMLLEARRP